MTEKLLYASTAGFESARCVTLLPEGHRYRLIQPTDVIVARWLRDQLALPGLEALGIQSTRHQGADLDRRGMRTFGDAMFSSRRIDCRTQPRGTSAAGCMVMASR